MSPINFTTFNQLAENLLQKKNLDALLEELIQKLTKILNAERATFYFFNEETKELWSYIAKKLEITEIRVPLGQGVAGRTAQKKKTLNIKNAAKCSYFYENVDKKTGFHTQTILSTPLINRNKKLLGVVQIINKKKGFFTKHDETFLKSISYYIVAALENILLIQEQETLLRSTLYALASAIDAKDPVTAGHTQRVAYYSVRLGQKIGLSDHDIKLLEYAAYLHDVGKIGVPDKVLNKKGRLTEKEFDIIKKHPEHTLQILKNIIFPHDQKEIPAISSSHHEYLDGSGYPFGLKGKEIHLFTRIITVADIYDALSSFDRPYKKHLSTKKVLAILKEEVDKNHLDKKLVNTFIKYELYKFERRRYKRLDLNIAISYQIIPQRRFIKEKLQEKIKPTLSDLKTDRPFFLLSKDISKEGLLFLTHQYLTVGTYLDLTLNINSWKLSTVGKIVWIEKMIGTSDYKIGVSFINLSKKIKQNINKALLNLSKKENS